jgi:NAD(P)H-dependent flavin oxidoreductase YrpB (nitropropane dioxygenase family)
VGLGLVPDQLGVSLHAGVFSAVFPDTGEVDSGRSAMPCGQGAGAITDELSCAAIIERVMREAEETIERLAGLRG